MEFFDRYGRSYNPMEYRKHFRFAHFKGSSTTVTNTSTYTPSEYELQLQKSQAKYADAISPNALWLNNVARDVLQDSIGTVQVDYNQMNEQAQNALQKSSQGYADLAQGILPQNYLQNMSDAIQSGVQSTVGNAVNSLANRGVINSSVANAAMNDISANTADTMARSYLNNIQTVAGLYGDQANIASAPITTAAASQEAAQAPAQNLWNMSLGLNGANTGALAAAAGKGTTTGTQTTTTSGGGGFFGGLLGGIASGLASGYGGAIANCFVAGTKIKMADGKEKNIEDIKVGDKVRFLNKKHKVINVMTPKTQQIIIVRTDSHEVHTTVTQSFMRSDMKLVPVFDLYPGVELLNAGTVREVSPIGFETVYDFETDGDNCYIANGFFVNGGSNDIWKE